jgi:catechol 2,3-dioxygenase-like lactoylglutathione lyase family enzyme
MKFLYTGIEVTDPELSIRFYHEGLGMAVAGRGLVAATGGETATLHPPGSEQMLELNWYPSSKYTPGSEVDHLAFEVEDVETAASRLVERGVASCEKSSTNPTTTSHTWRIRTASGSSSCAPSGVTEAPGNSHPAYGPQ